MKNDTTLLPPDATEIQSVDSNLSEVDASFDDSCSTRIVSPDRAQYVTIRSNVRGTQDIVVEYSAIREDQRMMRAKIARLLRSLVD